MLKVHARVEPRTKSENYSFTMMLRINLYENNSDHLATLFKLQVKF